MYKIAHLYPKELNLYGDKGNILYLTYFLNQIGIKSEVTDIGLKTNITEDFDFIFSGGGPDSLQNLVYKDFLTKKDFLIKHIEMNKPSVFVCGSFQLLGKYYLNSKNEKVPGLGIFNFYTQSPLNQNKRIVGNTYFKFKESFFGNTVVGFENHNGRTYLEDKLTPLGESFSKDSGNNDFDKGEGLLYKKTLGTYLHGPLFVKNPNILEFLLKDLFHSRYLVVYQLHHLIGILFFALF